MNYFTSLPIGQLELGWISIECKKEITICDLTFLITKPPLATLAFTMMQAACLMSKLTPADTLPVIGGSRQRSLEKFGSGWEVGGYATLTDVPFDTFGEGSFDKAIYVSIPIDWINSKPNPKKNLFYAQ